MTTVALPPAIINLTASGGVQQQIPLAAATLVLSGSNGIQQQVPAAAAILSLTGSGMSQFQIPITDPAVLILGAGSMKVWDGAAWKAWVEAYGNLATKYYYLTLTGDNETPPVADITIPMTSFQARRKSGDPTFLAAVIPGTDYEAAINARSNGEMIIEMAYELHGVIEYQEEIIRADLDPDGIRVDEGGRNQSIILTGHKTESFVSKVSWLHDVTYKRDIDGDLAYRCASCDLYLNPGDTAKYGSDSFTVNQVVLSISPELQIMEVEEAAT
ncbi:MAG: hypothetical protein JRF53_00540 [Deltaproteobacteria bacterium]|nr:hypothetical protein [Deltaproteobacteria bacterium]